MHISIRPEHLSIVKQELPGFTIKAKVKDFIYMGTIVKTLMDMPCGKEIKYNRFELDDSVKEGDTVYIYAEEGKSVPIHADVISTPEAAE